MKLVVLGWILLFSLCCESQVCILLTSCDASNESFHYYAATDTASALSLQINIENTEDVDQLGTGDRIMIIQMQGGNGVEINSNPSDPNFGTVSDYGTVGQYEFNFVSAVNTGCPNPYILLILPLSRTYVVDEFSTFQVVKTVYCLTVDVIENLICTPWDGKKGGVIAIEAGTLNLNDKSINCKGAGFRGGSIKPSSCVANTYPLGCSTPTAGEKGESIVKNSNYPHCRGSWASGGGGAPCNGSLVSSVNEGYGGGGGALYGIFILFYLFLILKI